MSPEAIREELQRIAREYGKVGLLIDDAPDAATRTARALYNSEALPRWWRQLHSLDCASVSLDAFFEIFEARGRLRGLLVIDRYLPPNCKQPRSIPWDRADSKLLDEEEQAALRFRERIKKLKHIDLKNLPEHPGASPIYYVQYVTSFQPMSTGPEETVKESLKIPWQRRSVETLQEERRAFRNNKHWQSLLRFGPEKDAPVSREKDDLSVAKWHATKWQTHLDKIASLMAEKKPVILLTGAGASLAPASTAPGMPLTYILLEEACSRFWKKRERRAGSDLAVEPIGCLCKPRPGPPAAEQYWDKHGAQSPIDWLIEQSEQKGSAAGLSCTLEDLFAEDIHIEKNGVEPFDEFHRAFRDALYRWDYGYAYHHWLLTRLPWTAIITTNFDGFHERAATAAATLPWLAVPKRLVPLRYANPVTWDAQNFPQFSKEDLAVRESLFKPYGSLYAPDGSLALSGDEIRSYRERLMNALNSIVGKGSQTGALVVVGHSMRDSSMDDLLQTIEKRLAGFDLFWVDPDSYKRSWGKEEKSDSPWERWMWKRVQEHGTGGGPIPATALEFICDLWATYLKQK